MMLRKVLDSPFHPLLTANRLVLPASGQSSKSYASLYAPVPLAKAPRAVLRQVVDGRTVRAGSNNRGRSTRSAVAGR
jgi:hypothetical protein